MTAPTTGNKLSALEAMLLVSERLGTTPWHIDDQGIEVLGHTNVEHPVHGCFAGSAAMLAYHQIRLGAGMHPDNPWFYSYGDLDFFMFNPNRDASHLVRADERLTHHGVLERSTWETDRMAVASRRVDVNGQPRWITNSTKLKTPEGIVVNLINKQVNGNCMLSCYDVLLTFDWSWLTVAAWDLSTGGVMGMRNSLGDYYASQGQDFLILTNRLQDFLDGIMSQHVMLRQMPRLAKYVVEFKKALEFADLNLYQDQSSLFTSLLDQAQQITDFMITAYTQYAEFMWERGTTESNTHGDIAAAYARAAKEQRWQVILDVAAKYGTRDTLDRMVDELL